MKISASKVPRWLAGVLLRKQCVHRCVCVSFIYICVCVCIHRHIHVYMYIYMHTHMHLSVFWDQESD